MRGDSSVSVLMEALVVLTINLNLPARRYLAVILTSRAIERLALDAEAHWIRYTQHDHSAKGALPSPPAP